MRNSRNARALLGSVIFVLLVLVSAFGVAALGPKAGIDLVFEIQPLDGSSSVTADQLGQARAAVETRLTNLSATQFKVRLQDANRLVADVVGKTDPEVTANILSQPGFIEFIDGGGSCPSPGTLALTTTGPPPAPIAATQVYTTYIIGADVDPGSVQDSVDPNSDASQVNFDLKGDPVRRMQVFTASHRYIYLAVLLDKQVITCFKADNPFNVKHMVISDLPSVSAAHKLSFFLKSGALPVRLTVVQSKSVDHLDLNASIAVAEASVLVAQPHTQGGVEMYSRPSR